MMPFGQDVTVYREERDRVGNVRVLEERTLHGVALAPRSAPGSSGSRETGPEGRNTVASSLTMYAPPGSGITAFHRVRLADGTVWQVEGNGARWQSPFTGWTPGDQFDLEQITG